MRSHVALVALLLLGGCSSPLEYEPEPEPTRSRPRPSPTASAVRAELVTTLQRMNAATYRFSMNTNTAEGGTVTATGTVDPAGKRYETTTAVSGARAATYTLVIVGNDSYVKQAGDRFWVHLDMARVEPGSPVYVDTADPSGLARFIANIEKAQPVRRDAAGWSGEFHPGGKGPYLPVGSPAFVTIATEVPFTVTVDGQGLVTSIVVTMALTSGPEITMTTTFLGHGTAAQIQAPPKGSTREADDLFYRK
jgi:hypothetical protein